MIHFTPPPDFHLWGPLVVNVHSLAFCVGALAAYLWTWKRLEADYREHLDNIALWMTVGGLLGARLLFALGDYRLLSSPAQILAFWEGGLISYGGFAGAIAAWWGYLRYYGLSPARFAQAMGPPALLGWGLGRWGCFLAWNGELGVYTDLPWGFQVGEDAPRHPVMLYLALWNCLWGLACAKLSPRWQVNGAALSLFFFGAGRAVLDYWRDYDPSWLYWGSLAFSLMWVILAFYLMKIWPYSASTAPSESKPTEPAEGAI